MTREEFSRNLRKATLRSHELALMTVENELKQPFLYLVKLNQISPTTREILSQKAKSSHEKCAPKEENLSALYRMTRL